MARKRVSKPAAEAEAPPPLVVVPSTRFKRDLERQKARGKDLAKLYAVAGTLANRQPLDPKYRDHALTGDWTGYRDCHVEADWVLIYERTDAELRLTRTGSHSDLNLT